MNLDQLPFVPCNHRTPRSGPVDLIVVHTNEGPEQTNSAEGLAAYLQHVDPGYNVVVDVDSAIRCAQDNEVVWGAGGVNGRAWHLCLLGYSNQTLEQWDDPYSRSELVNAAQLVRQAAARLGVPMTRTADSRPGNRGICGHVDVSRYYPASQGHTDPGEGFPWDEFLAMVADTGPTAEQIAAYFALLEELDVEHGQAVDAVHVGGNVVLTLERWGGLVCSDGRKMITSGYWPGKDVARKIVLTTKAPVAGWVLDLKGGLHPFHQDGAPGPAGIGTPAYWHGGKVLDFNEI